MIEQSEIMKAKLSCGIVEQRAQLRQVRAGARRISEAIAQSPHCSRSLARIVSPWPAKHNLQFTSRYETFVK